MGPTPTFLLSSTYSLARIQDNGSKLLLAACWHPPSSHCVPSFVLQWCLCLCIRVSIGQWLRWVHLGLRSSIIQAGRARLGYKKSAISHMHNAWEGGWNSCGLSVCAYVGLLSPPRCLHLAAWYFQGMLGSCMALHSSDMIGICWDIKYFC